MTAHAARFAASPKRPQPEPRLGSRFGRGRIGRRVLAALLRLMLAASIVVVGSVLSPLFADHAPGDLARRSLLHQMQEIGPEAALPATK